MSNGARISTLSEIAAAAGEVVQSRAGDARISGVSYDSRRVGAGDIFVCVPGHLTDGHAFASDAVARGAAALCVERRLGLGVPELVTTSARIAMGRIASFLYGHPADDLDVLAVTGTNGKTTTAFLLDAILRAAGRKTGLIGTVETRIGAGAKPGVRTTPESVDLHRLFAEMRAAGVDAVAMEVTSHALALHRVERVRFAAAAFTNLSQDHLDFHASMEDYFNAKRSLFVPGRVVAGAVNVDDPYGRRLAGEVDVPVLTFGLSPDADVRAEKVEMTPEGTSFVIVGPATEIEIETSLVGSFNVSNCLAAAATALQAGLDGPEVATGIASLSAVPGRFESVVAGQPFPVIVDYAHTPDSLDNVLRAARSLARGRLICVFGCGGDRDRGKRPLMGAVAATLADVIVVTSDNPRSESPEAIVGEIVEGIVGVRAAGPDAVLVDRRAAIEHALRVAVEGDVVVIAGKGHEIGQEFHDQKVPFDDRLVAAQALTSAGWPGTQGPGA